MSIKVYSTSSCSHCAEMKQYLDENSIAYENVDVAINREAAAEMIAKTGKRAVPVIDIDGEVIVGFEKDKISQLLNL